MSAVLRGGELTRAAYNRAKGLRPWANSFALALGDAVVFALAFWLFQSDPRGPRLEYLAGSGTGQEHSVPVFAIVAALFIGISFVAGAYQRRQLFWDGARDTIRALLVASIPELALCTLAMGRMPFFPTLATWTFVIIVLPVTRHAVKRLLGALGLWRVATALIGRGAHSSQVCPAIAGTTSLGFDIQFLCPRDEDDAPLAKLPKVRQLHEQDPASLALALQAAGCEQAVIAAGELPTQEMATLVQRLMEAQIGVNIVPSFSSFPMVGLGANTLFGRGVLLLKVQNNLGRVPQRVIKRVFDIAGSIALIVLFLPAFAYAAIAIKRDDNGALFYAQRRVGYRKREFWCLKFRTMKPNADAEMQRWKDENPKLYEEFWKSYKLRDDPRVTKAGKWLRSSSLDELPQLFNVLVGDMSLVGPRPVPQEQLIRHFGQSANIYNYLRPGLTGLWQISGRSDVETSERIVYDEWYLLNWSIWGDIVILLQTAWTVAGRGGAY